MYEVGGKGGGGKALACTPSHTVGSTFFYLKDANGLSDLLAAFRAGAADAGRAL